MKKLLINGANFIYFNDEMSDVKTTTISSAAVHGRSCAFESHLLVAVVFNL
jgi:hypothetical protein